MAIKYVSLRNRLPGNWRANQGRKEKTTAPVGHYNGPPTRVRTKEDAVRQLIADARYHMRIDWGGGARANGIQYHSAVWEDTVFLLRDPLAILWHCGSWPHNGTSHAVHVPIGDGQRCSDRTLATLEEWIDEICDTWDIPRSVLGHQELSPTSCPGWLQNNFVLPYRRGGSFTGGGPTQGGRKTVPHKKYTIIHAGTRWSVPRAALFNEAAPDLVGRCIDPRRASAISREVRHNDPAGEMVAVVLGSGGAKLLHPDAKEVLGKYGRDTSDIWEAYGRAGTDRSALAEIVHREGLNDSILGKWDRRFGPKKGNPPGPATGGKAAIIDRYFASLNPAWKVPYEPIGGVLIEEASRAGLSVEAACALVEQESAGRNVFGCDHGASGDRPPYCHQRVTADRVRRLRSSGKMNGVGLTQLTWHTFVTQAQEMGGAHIPRYQMRVGFRLLAGYFSRYGEPDAWGAYNAGEANRASVRNTYSRACMQKRDAWYRRLKDA